MNKIEERRYNKMASNPVLATIDCIRKLNQLGKNYDKQLVEHEVRESTMFKDKQITEEDISLILSSLEDILNN